MKAKLRSILASLDPLRLLDELRSMQRHIASLVAGTTDHAPPHRDADLDRFLASLESAWREGEVRPTHQPKPKLEHYWRTRKDPFEAVWPEVIIWLEAEPDSTAKELFERLCEKQPDAFAPGQLRTLQRRVKDWRRMAARRLVFGEGQPPDEPMPAP